MRKPKDAQAQKRARASGARATIDEVGVGGGGYPQPMVIGTLLAGRSPKLTPAPPELPAANTLDDAYATLRDSHPFQSRVRGGCL
jgi:hypothetical protein